MIAPKEHENEKERLEDLSSYSILDTLSESEYDAITALAAEICGTKVSLISLVDDKRQWFKSKHGLIDTRETPKEYAFCAHAINEPEDLFIIGDTKKDERFYDNPLVTGNLGVSFYAGVPLMSDRNNPLGTLCVIDDKPRELTEGQKKSLKALGEQVMIILNLRKTKLELEQTVNLLERKNAELERFAYVAAHDLKSPLASISGLSSILLEHYTSGMDEDGKKMLDLIKKSTQKLNKLVEGLLSFSRIKDIQNKEKEEIDIVNLLDDVRSLIGHSEELKLTKKVSVEKLVVNKTALEQILLNLIVNALKYNDKETVEIEIGIDENETYYLFYVQDNGPGISPENHKKIFDIFKTIGQEDRFGKKGHGIGLATVKKVVESCGGSINVDSEISKGARFNFSIKK